MPDIGGIRRRLADQARQAKQVAQHASQAGLQHIENARPTARKSVESEDDDSDGNVTEADVAEEVGRLRSFLASHRPPPGPVEGRWSVGLGDLLAEHPRVPSAARDLVRNLDRYGHLAISEEAIEFDQDSIEWASVTEIRTRNVVDYLLSSTLIRQIDSLPLPRFPGRRRVLNTLSKALLTLVVSTAHRQLDQHADLYIPTEIEYRGTLRRSRQLSPGILAALVMADPAVNACVLATARAHGIAVTPADGNALGDAAQRADSIRAKLGPLESKLDHAAAAPGVPPTSPSP